MLETQLLIPDVIETACNKNAEYKSFAESLEHLMVYGYIKTTPQHAMLRTILNEIKKLYPSIKPLLINKAITIYITSQYLTRLIKILDPTIKFDPNKADALLLQANVIKEAIKAGTNAVPQAKINTILKELELMNLAKERGYVDLFASNKHTLKKSVRHITCDIKLHLSPIVSFIKVLNLSIDIETFFRTLEWLDIETFMRQYGYRLLSGAIPRIKEPLNVWINRYRFTNTTDNTMNIIGLLMYLTLILPDDSILRVVEAPDIKYTFSTEPQQLYNLTELLDKTTRAVYFYHHETINKILSQDPANTILIIQGGNPGSPGGTDKIINHLGKDNVYKMCTPTELPTFGRTLWERSIRKPPEMLNPQY
jgi:hypothetical protein